MPEIIIRDPERESDWEQFERIQVDSFAIPVDTARAEVTAQREHALTRFAFVDGKLAGGYSVFPVSQYFGGRAVPAGAIESVVTAAINRRQGVGAALMADVPSLFQERGLFLAPLWAASPRFYRRWGWDVGDHSLLHTVKLSSLSSMRGEGSLDPAPDPDDAEALYHQVAASWNGSICRPDWWRKLPDSGPVLPEHKYRVGWREHGELTGFIRYGQSRPKGFFGPGVINVTDLYTLSGNAMLGLLGYIGGHAAQVQEMTIRAPMRHDLLYAIEDANLAITANSGMTWMQRVTDIPGALGARGWNPDYSGSFSLEVVDPVPGRSRTVRIEIANGKGHAQQSATADTRIDAGFFASWFAGSAHAELGQRLGRIRGNPATISEMDRAMDHRPVWLQDVF